MLQFTDQQYDAGGNDGYYQHILLKDIIDNFMISETTQGMDLENVSRTMVEFLAHRGVQELSYDTLRTVKSFSFQMEGALSFAIPQDAVGIVGVYWADDAGYKHPMQQRRFSGNPETPLLDEEGNYMYDNLGNRLNAENSSLIANYNSRQDSVGADEFYNYYAGSFENDELYDRYYSYYGRRFGSQPSETNVNGTYLYDEEEGTIFIDSNFSDAEIIVDYVSDGIGTDPALIRVHKFAEQAIYSYIRKMIITRKANTPLYEKQLATKMHAADKKRAKIRLLKVSSLSIYQSILNKQKWIKR